MSLPVTEARNAGTNSGTLPALGQLSSLLLELYRIAAGSTSKQFQAQALAATQQVVHFDSAMWGTGSWLPTGVEVHTVYLDRQPAEMMQNYEKVKQYDTLASESYRQLGVTLNVSASDPRFVPHPELAAHTRRYYMAHALATNFSDGMQLFTAISLFRADPERPYSENERQLIQALVPHLAETWSNCRLRSVSGADELLESTPRARALCDRRGILHAAAPSFAALLRTEWPEWQGPTLPEILLGKWLNADQGQHTGVAIVVTSEAVGDLRMLKLRKLSLLDRLTTRELEVARLFGSGSSHKSIAQALHLAPVTVRNHLQTTYGKLGVSDKAALAKLLHIVEG